MTSRLMQHQPAPIPNDVDPPIWHLVIQDLLSFKLGFDPAPIITDCIERDEFGAKQYGTHLQSHNGRDFSADAYQECLDLVVYLRGWNEEFYTAETLDMYLTALRLLNRIRQESDRLGVSHD